MTTHSNTINIDNRKDDARTFLRLYDCPLMRELAQEYVNTGDNDIISDMMDLYKNRNTVANLDYNTKEDRETMTSHLVKMIVKEHPEVESFDWEKKEKLLIGLVQSGKSGLAAKLMCYMTLRGYKCAFWQQNLDNEVAAMVKKLIRLVKHVRMDLIHELRETGYMSIKLPEVKVFNAKSEKNIKDYFKSKTGILVGATNAVQIKRYTDGALMTRNKDFKKVQVFDEADKLVYAKGKEDDEELRNIANNVKRLRNSDITAFSIQITATPTDCLGTAIECGQVANMPPPPHYKGFGHGITIVIMETNIFKAKKDEDLMKAFTKRFPTYEKRLTMLTAQIPYSVFIEDKFSHKMSIGFLDKTSNRKDAMKRKRDWIINHDTFRENWTTIVEIGDGIEFFHHRVKGEQTFGGKKVSPDERGVYKLPKSFLIEELLGWMFHNGGTDKFPRYYIISGKLADRSKSYVYVPEVEDGKGEFSKGYWHLTHEFYDVKNISASKVPNHMQAMRLSHTFPDNILLYLWQVGKITEDMTEENARLNKYYELIKETKTENPETLVCDIDFNVNEKRKTISHPFAGTINKKKKLKYTKEEDDLDTTKDYEKIEKDTKRNRAELKRFGEETDYTDAKVEVGAEETKGGEEEETKEEGKIDGVELSKLGKWFSKWGRKNLPYISKLVRTLYQDDREFEVDELISLCEYTPTDTGGKSKEKKFGHILDCGRGVACRYGKLFISKNHKWSLNPKIRDYINKNKK